MAHISGLRVYFVCFALAIVSLGRAEGKPTQYNTAMRTCKQYGSGAPESD